MARGPVVVFLGLLVPAVAEAETPSWTLGDDECQSGGPCALDALQRRGLMRSDDAWKEVMAALVPQIQNLVFQDNELNVAKEMRKAMKGTCLTLDEYRASDRPFSDHWQCGSEGFNNFGDAAYIPSERVIDGLSQFAGLPLKTLAKFHLHSNNDSEALYGKWCGMPAPPEYEDALTGRPVGARAFWEECVMRNAGYFNALICDTNDSYAVLGIAALNHGVCYPAHVHDNQEAYWQIRGPGWWRTWPQNFTKAPNEWPWSEIRMTKPQGPWQLHNHPGGLVHEMDTTSDDDFLLTVYWWGKPVDTEVNYAYSHAVQEQGSCFRRYRAEHNDAAHSCPNMMRPPWAVFRSEV
ncbi:unnamed protein product [Durusdinium trenchii]|uniref:Uncharacterized protein n=2 Tax=Durusdinium trenchii TaxID=1381693 RepID=A0ABP0NZT0_9DINO